MPGKRRTLLQFGSSETDADIFYGSGFVSHDPYHFIEHQGKSFLVVAGFEADRARSQTKVHTVWSAVALFQRQAGRGDKTRIDMSPAGIAAAALRKIKVRNIEVPAHFPVGVADTLRKAGFRVCVKEGEAYPERLIKTDDEVQAIIKVQRAVERAMAQAESVLRTSQIQRGRLLFEGKTLCAEHLKSVIRAKLVEQNCHAEQIIVAPGDQATEPHNEGNGPIRPGELVVIDVFPRSMHTRYWADMTRTFVKGRPSEQLIRQYRAVVGAQKLALSRIRPGVKMCNVHMAVDRYLKLCGYQTGEKDGRLQGFIHSTGHGVGLELHERPTFGKNTQTRFLKGMVVTVEPGLYYPGVGGARIEDLVVVTRDGVRNLTRYPKRLIL